MPDKRKHRGPHPADHRLFAAPYHEKLREAVADLSWLLSRGYTEPAALKLVGDRFQLTERQRLAVRRSSCSDQSLHRRMTTRLGPEQLKQCDIEIDGFNLLTSIEAALADGVLLIGRDGCLRDMASMHGSYRKMDETRPALRLIGECLAEHHAGQCRWLFDRPVSNSGRVAQLVRETGAEYRWNWEAACPDDPDRALIASSAVVVSADSGVIDQCRQWFGLAGHIVRSSIPDAMVVDLSGRHGERPA